MCTPQAKYPEFNTMAFTAITACVDSFDNCLSEYEFASVIPNALELFNGQFRREGVVQQEFVSVFHATGQQNCGMQRPGFHTECNDGNRARWGFCNNIPSQGCQESDGSDADGVIGFGIAGQDCCPTGAGFTNYFVHSSADSGHEPQQQAWILVRP